MTKVTAARCTRCPRKAISRTYGKGLCNLCYHERNLTPEQRAANAEARSARTIAMFQDGKARKRLPRTGVTVNPVTVMAYYLHGRENYREQTVTIPAGTQVYHDGVHDGLYHAELEDGGRCLISPADMKAMPSAEAKKRNSTDNKCDERGNCDH